MYLLVFIIGTIFGSLGSVLLTRLEDKITRPTIKGILFGFSKCPHCQKRLHAKNLIPLFSFFFQKGKCEYCRKPISTRYPILEICSGLIFMFSYYFVFDVGSYIIPQGLHRISYVFRAITNRGLLLIIIQDIKKQELHMPIWIFTTGRILIWQFVRLQGNYKAAFIASLIFAAVTALIYFGSKLYVKIRYKTNEEGFGQGDIYLGFTLGAAIPFIEQFNALEFSRQNHIKIVIIIILMASIFGLIYALISQILNKQVKTKISNTHKTIIPFFPTLIISFWILLIYGDKIISYIFL